MEILPHENRVRGIRVPVHFGSLVSGLILAAVLGSFAGCGGESAVVPLFGRMEPGDASAITAFLDRHQEPYTLRSEGRAMTVLVAADRADLLREYLSDPVDSVRYIQLVKTCRLAEKDSSRIRVGPPESARKLSYLAGDRPDSTTVGAAFAAVFREGRWKTARTRDREIVVEFTGTMGEHALETAFGVKVLGELTGHREYLAAEAGAPGARWMFRWRIGIEGKSLVKESTRVTLGGKGKSNGRGEGVVLHIDL